jgi:hypothetical protein
MLLLEGLGDAAPTVLAVPPPAIAPNTGTIPSIAGQPAMVYRPIEQARGWYTLYAYSTQAGQLLYYQWTFTPGVRPTINYVGQAPWPPQPPMGQFPTLDIARAAMVSHLNAISLAQPPSAPTPILAAAQPMTLTQLLNPAAPQVYASPFLPTPESVAAAQPPAPPVPPPYLPAASEIPDWAKPYVFPALTAGGILIILMLLRRR